MPTETFYNLSEEKKNKIIKAAIKEFSRVAPNEVLVKNIVEDAQIARGSFYQYFKSKDDLLQFILEKDFEETEEFVFHDLKEKNGDIFEVYIDIYDFLLNKIEKTNKRDFCKKILENLKTSDNSFFHIDIPNLKTNIRDDSKREEILKLVNTESFINPKEIEYVINILFLITKKEIVTATLSDKPEILRKDYIKMINIVKRGCLKENT